MTDDFTLGSLYTPASYEDSPAMSGELWAKIAKKKPGLGNPETFFSHPDRMN